MISIATTAQAEETQLPAPHDRPELVQRLRAAQIERNAARRQGGLVSFLAWVKLMLARLNIFPPMRAFGIYTMRHGPLMAAGCAYNMFFSVAAMLVAGFSVLGLVVSGNTDLQKIVIDGVAKSTPGLIKTNGSDGLVGADQLFSMGTGLSITLVISLVSLALTSLGWIAGLREGIRGVFDLQPLQMNGVVLKLRDIGTLLVLGIVVVVTSVISFGVSAAMGTLIDELNLNRAVFGTLAWVISIIVLVLIDMSVAIVLFSFASGVKMPRRISWETALLTAIGSTVLRSLSSLILSNVAGKNPLLAPFSVILGLFVWFFFLSQVYLICAGWGAMRLADAENARKAKGEPARLSMRAVVQRRFGDYGVLSYTTVPTPQPGPREVRVRVEAAGVEAETWYRVSGRPKFTRFLKNGFLRPGNKVPGRAFSGVVDAVGSKVKTFTPGDAVLGTIEGAYAEYVLTTAERLVSKPETLSHAQAAALPISAGAAMQALQLGRGVVGDLRGKKILVLGAGGGVGHYVVQAAHDAGAKVTGVCSTSKAEFVKSLGANEVLNYRTDEPTKKVKRRWDVIVDCSGGRSMSSLQFILDDKGALILVARHSEAGTTAKIIAGARNALTSQKILALTFHESTRDVQRLVDLANDGVLKPRVEAQYPLADAEEAIAQVHNARVPGKTVLSIGERD